MMTFIRHFPFVVPVHTLLEFYLPIESAHTASKERTVSDLMFSFECMPQLSITESESTNTLRFQLHYTAQQN